MTKKRCVTLYELLQGHRREIETKYEQSNGVGITRLTQPTRIPSCALSFSRRKIAPAVIFSEEFGEK